MRDIAVCSVFFITILFSAKKRLVSFLLFLCKIGNNVPSNPYINRFFYIQWPGSCYHSRYLYRLKLVLRSSILLCI
ncbi:hypothetical protein EDC96DRAFT_497217 [Choanephora cucurbitarum]|nr:hypothetical protein EDC96DRAFT_497217 [Choanephora cucurbitarum]